MISVEEKISIKVDWHDQEKGAILTNMVSRDPNNKKTSG